MDDYYRQMEAQRAYEQQQRLAEQYRQEELRRAEEARQAEMRRAEQDRQRMYEYQRQQAEMRRAEQDRQRMYENQRQQEEMRRAEQDRQRMYENQRQQAERRRAEDASRRMYEDQCQSWQDESGCYEYDGAGYQTDYNPGDRFVRVLYVIALVEVVVLGQLDFSFSQILTIMALSGVASFIAASFKGWSKELTVGVGMTYTGALFIMPQLTLCATLGFLGISWVSFLARSFPGNALLSLLVYAAIFFFNPSFALDIGVMCVALCGVWCICMFFRQIFVGDA